MAVKALWWFVTGAVSFGCDTPHTEVVLANDSRSVVYRAQWHIATFADPLLPGAASEPQDADPASATDAYVLLAPGWDPNGTTKPTSIVVLRSRAGFELHLDQTLRISVSDDTFAGNCAAGSFLARDEADFITQRVFADVFANTTYDPSTCTMTP